MHNNLLIVGNYSPGVGYAWNTIQEYFLALGTMFVGRGSRAYICYPEVDTSPEVFLSSGIGIVRFDFSSNDPLRLYRFLTERSIRTIYLTDRPVFSWKYLVARAAGVRTIVVHDRTSGDRDTPGLFKRWIKTALNRCPGLSADVAVAISDYVRKRLINVACFPECRTVRIWNGIDIEKFTPGPDDLVFERYPIPRDKKIVFASSRAAAYKGIPTLIEAARILVREEKRKDAAFLFCGDGPDLNHFRSLIIEKGLDGVFLCPGNAATTARLLRGVTVMVVPSLWQEGFGLSVIEGMATEKVVIASRVGGIPEIISDGRDGYLVPPGDSRALAVRIAAVLDDEDLRRTMGAAARRTVVARFNIENKKKELMDLFAGLETSGVGHA